MVESRTKKVPKDAKPFCKESVWGLDGRHIECGLSFLHVIGAHALCSSSETAFVKIVENECAKRYVGRNGHDARNARAKVRVLGLEVVVLEMLIADARDDCKANEDFGIV